MAAQNKQNAKAPMFAGFGKNGRFMRAIAKQTIGAIRCMRTSQRAQRHDHQW